MTRTATRRRRHHPPRRPQGRPLTTATIPTEATQPDIEPAAVPQPPLLPPDIGRKPGDYKTRLASDLRELADLAENDPTGFVAVMIGWQFAMGTIPTWVHFPKAESLDIAKKLLGNVLTDHRDIRPYGDGRHMQAIDFEALTLLLQGWSTDVPDPNETTATDLEPVTA